MALTVSDSGRVTTAPSGTSLPPELSQLLAQQMAGTGSGGPSGIYLDISLNGKQGNPVRLRRSNRVVESPNSRRVSSLDEAVNIFYQMDDDYREALQKRMWYYGLIDGPNNTAQALGQWAKAVELAWNFKVAGKDVDPVDMFGRMTNLRAGQLGNQPRTIRQRQVNFTDPEQVKVWLREAFQSSMGRDPHDAEIRQMIGAIASGNRRDPYEVETTTDADGNSTQRVIDPGFDPQAYIRNQMDDDPEAAAHQAADTYYPALMQAIMAPV